MPTVWETQSKVGENGAEILDTFFTERGLNVRSTPTEVDKLGIDRVFVNQEGKQYSVEYKTDVKAGETGNFFIELQQRNGKDGWAYKCLAQRIVLFVPGRGVCYVLETERIKDNIQNWQEKYPLRTCGRSSGVIVPIDVLAVDTNAKRMQITNERQETGRQ